MRTYDVQNIFQGGYTKERTSTRYIVVHHAAALYRQPTGIEDVRAVADYHTKSRGWAGIGYHIALAEEINGGSIVRYNLSDLDLQRAHIAYRNYEAIGVACLTNFGGSVPDDKWVTALAEVLTELVQRYPDAQIVGHRDIALGPTQSPDGSDYRTACPGSAWPQWKPDLIARVATPTPRPTLKTLPYVPRNPPA